jgi:hypothetical protein
MLSSLHLLELHNLRSLNENWGGFEKQNICKQNCQHKFWEYRFINYNAILGCCFVSQLASVRLLLPIAAITSSSIKCPSPAGTLLRRSAGKYNGLFHHVGF